jgi:tripartite-type tricarboxylate transporter receptor subunit TctC
MLRSPARVTFMLALGIGLLQQLPARADNYPTKPITIIVSLAAGTGMDTLVRVYGEKLSQALGQPVIIENKPGGAGVVAGETITKGAPDGYTLAVATSAVMSIRPTLFKVRPFDPLTDFVPISHYVKSPFAARPAAAAWRARFGFREHIPGRRVAFA